MKVIRGSLVVVVLGAAALWWVWRPAAQAPAGPPPSPAPPAAPRPASPEVAAARGFPLAARLNAPGAPPEGDVVVLHDLIRQYLTALQRRAGPPLGDDADVVKALTGRNPLKLTVIPPGHPAISPQGRLLDRWGTPYHIHALSAMSYEVRSAGPDKKLFTEDDFVDPRKR